MNDKVLLPVDENALRQFLTGELQREMREALGKLADGQRATTNHIEDTFTQLKGRCSATTTKIDDDLEKLKDKANKRLNQTVLPLAALILVAGIVALWALVGGLALQLRKETNDALAEAGAHKKELADMGTQILALKGQLDEMKAGTSIVNGINGRLGKIDEQLKTINAQIGEVRKVTTRLDAQQKQP